MARKSFKYRRFDGGISDDIRIQADGQFASTENFNIRDFPTKLRPHETLSQDQNSFSSTVNIRKFEIWNNSTFGLGQVSAGTARPRIWQLSVAPGGSGSWTSVASAGSGGTVTFNLFKQYKDYIYGFSGTDTIFRYGPLSSSPSITDSYTTFSSAVTVTTEGVLGADDVLYFGIKNSGGTSFCRLASINGSATLTQNELDLPATETAVQLAQWGKYLAIGTFDTSNQTSYINIWDYVSSDLTERVKIEGRIGALENLDGTLIATTYEATTDVFRPQITFWGYSGGQPYIIKTIVNQYLSTSLETTSIQSFAKIRRGVYYVWLQTATGTSGTASYALWSLGRKTRSYPLSLTKERVVSAITSSNPVKDYVFFGDRLLISYQTGASTSSSYSPASITSFESATLETQVLNGGSSVEQKKLVGVKVSSVPLTASATVVISYRKNSETSYTTLKTQSTDNAIETEVVNVVSTGASLPTFHEIQFKAESTGGAEITGFEAIYDDVNGAI
jgi:hypothetical protein